MTKLVYSFSPGSQEKLMDYSLRISLSYFDKSEISLICTLGDKEKIDRIGSKYSEYEIIFRDNIDLGNNFDRYMNRLYMRDIDGDTLIFLGNDAELIDDPKKLIDDDFDFLGEKRDLPSYETHFGGQFFIINNGKQELICNKWEEKYKELCKGDRPPVVDETSLWRTVTNNEEVKYKLLPNDTIVGDQAGYRKRTFDVKDDTYVIHW